MEITIFSKKRKTQDGRAFTTFITALTNKSGERVPMSVNFPQDSTPNPNDCPFNINVEKSDCNISTREYTVEDTGEIRTSRTLWIKKWNYGSPYVDHSTDEFM